MVRFIRYCLLTKETVHVLVITSNTSIRNVDAGIYYNRLTLDGVLTVSTSDGKPMNMRAERLAQCTSWSTGALAWHELALYRRDTANFAIALRTCRGPMGSSDVFHARIFKTLEAALAWLQAFSPVADLGAAIEAPEGTVNLGGNAIRATDPHQNAEQVEQRYRVMINELVGRMDAVP